jgi:hypothetical protein
MIINKNFAKIEAAIHGLIFSSFFSLRSPRMGWAMVLKFNMGSYVKWIPLKNNLKDPPSPELFYNWPYKEEDFPRVPKLRCADGERRIKSALPIFRQCAVSIYCNVCPFVRCED